MNKLDILFKDPEFILSMKEFGDDVRMALAALKEFNCTFHALVSDDETYVEVTRDGEIIGLIELPNVAATKFTKR